MSDFLFIFVIQTDLLVDIFFWMTAFLGSYLLLVKIKNNDGATGSWLKIYLHRVVRLLP